ncbi:MAG: hypothetical protein Q9212_007527, partial [Teloschistes hypoglaucus]
MPAAIEGHIPAWKRLGLKLKHAPEQAAPPPEASSPAPAPPSKRKLPDEETDIPIDHATLESAKKSKKSKKSDDRAQIVTNGTHVPEPPVPVAEVALTKPKPHRKSVSFAPEAKTEDGESAKDLYNSWIVSQKQSDPSFDPSVYKQDALKNITPRSIVAPPSKLDSGPVTDTPASEDIQTPTKKKKKKKKKRN